MRSEVERWTFTSPRPGTSARPDTSARPGAQRTRAGVTGSGAVGLGWRDRFALSLPKPPTPVTHHGPDSSDAFRADAIAGEFHVGKAVDACQCLCEDASVEACIGRCGQLHELLGLVSSTLDDARQIQVVACLSSTEHGCHFCGDSVAFGENRSAAKASAKPLGSQRLVKRSTSSLARSTSPCACSAYPPASTNPKSAKRRRPRRTSSSWNESIRLCSACELGKAVFPSGPKMPRQPHLAPCRDERAWLT